MVTLISMFIANCSWVSFATKAISISVPIVKNFAFALWQSKQFYYLIWSAEEILIKLVSNEVIVEEALCKKVEISSI